MPKGLVWISTTRNAIRNFVTSKSGNVIRLTALPSIAKTLLSKFAAMTQSLTLIMAANDLNPLATSLG